MEENNSLTVFQEEQVRHPKMVGINTSYLEKMKDEIDLDNELGLSKQATIDAKSTFGKDVDELTRSNEYYQVTPGLIEKMFEVPALRRMCWGYNIWETIRTMVFTLRLSIIGFLITSACIAGALLLNVKLPSEGIVDSLCFIAKAVLWVAGGILAILTVVIPFQDEKDVKVEERDSRDRITILCERKPTASAVGGIEQCPSNKSMQHHPI